MCHDELDEEELASGSLAKLANLMPPLLETPLEGVPGSTAKFANLIAGRAGSSFSELARPEELELGSGAKPARRNPETEEESTVSFTSSSSLLFKENGWTVAIFRGGTESRDRVGDARHDL